MSCFSKLSRVKLSPSSLSMKVYSQLQMYVCVCVWLDSNKVVSVFFNTGLPFRLSSMAPSFVMTSGHLRLQEPSEPAISRPSHPIALLDAALNDDFLLDDDVNVDPDAISQHLIKFGVRIGVFLVFCATELPPEPFATPVAVLGQCPSTDGQFGGWVALGLLLLLCPHGMGLVKAVFELINGRPTYILRTSCLSVAEHREDPTWTDVHEKVFDQRDKKLIDFVVLDEGLEELEDQVRDGVEMLDHCVSLIGETLHLNKGHWEVAQLVPDVQHDIDLQDKQAKLQLKLR